MELTKNQRIIFGGIAIVLISIIGYYIMKQNSTSEETYVLNYEEKLENKEEETEEIIVHIAGCVRNEGIVRIKKGARMFDAIEEAGGLLQNADITNINLAYIVLDGQKIYIPSVEETEIENNEKIQEYTVEESKKVNINTATKEELKTLPRNRRCNCREHIKISRRKRIF